MPSNRLLMDTSFPDFSKGDSTEKKIKAIQDYLFLLLEQLRYTLNNLSAENVNTKELDDFVDTITKPINIKLAEGDKKMTEIKTTVDGLTIDITQDGNTINYVIGSNGLQISSTRCIEFYSLDGKLPPVGLAAGVVVNKEGDQALGNGWYDTWDESWIGVPVYVCTSYDSGATWGAVFLRQGVEGQSALSAMLNNNPFTFAGDTDNAKAGQARVGVLAFRGDTRIPLTIGTIRGHVDGLTTAVYNNGTDGAYFVATATTDLTTQSGTLEIPVTAGGKSLTLYWSWSVAFRGASGDNANVTFRAVNSALGNLFKTWAGGTPTTVTDSYIYAPQIKGGEIYGTKIYAGEGNGYSEMSGTGFNLWTELGFKAGIGYWTTEKCEYPYMILGVGTGTDGAGAAIVQKLGAGIWIGDGCLVSAGGRYPGDNESAVNISADYPYATGIFIDFDGDAVYKYINGAPSEISSGGSSSGSTGVYLQYS